MVRIDVAKLVQGNLDHEDGSRLYHAIRLCLKENDNAEIDFSDVDIVTSSFLNTSFRILAKEYDYSFLREHLKIRNSNSLINKMIRECMESAVH
jgi:hypothetical protein